MIITCLGCGATTSNGLALCGACQTKAGYCLEFIPVYFRNLSRWSRPARPNGSLGSRGEWLIRRGESEGNRVGSALDRAGNMLTTWARCLGEARPVGVVPPLDLTEAETVTWLCEIFDKHLTSIATTDWCGELVRDLAKHEAELRALTQDAMPGWYAGACKQCEVATYVVPGMAMVSCTGCGVWTYARDHLEQVLTEARGWVATPVRLAEALVALLDTEQSILRLRNRIAQWSKREQVAALRMLDEDGDPVGPKRYRLGEVMDRLQAEGETRLDDTGTTTQGDVA